MNAGHIITLLKNHKKDITKALTGITDEPIERELQNIKTVVNNISEEITPRIEKLKENNFQNNVTLLNTAIKKIMEIARDSKDDIEILEKLKQPQTDFKNAVEEISISLDFSKSIEKMNALTKAIDNIITLLDKEKKKNEKIIEADDASKLPENLKKDENNNKKIIETLETLNKAKTGIETVNKLATMLHDVGKKQLPEIADKINSLTYAFIDLKIYNNRKANEKSDSEVLAKAFNVTERLVSVIDTFMPKGETKFDVAILAMKSGAAITAGDYPEGLLLLSEALSKLHHGKCGQSDANCTRRQQIISILRPAMPLLTDLASAESPEQVKSIFSDAASPIGAWKLKRVNSLVSIGGILGVGIGYEKLNATDDKGNFTTNSTSVFAPVGIDFSLPIKDFRNGVTAPKSSDGSLGIFLSVIDLGNLVNQRYAEQGANDTISGQSNTTFTQVLSPGFYFKWGIGNSPLVTGVGVSYNPQIRDVKNTPTDAVVYRAYVGIDIVMFLTDLLSK